jgi:predicted GNAT family N-acyltransferase
MAVEASCRKRGVGRALLAMLEAHAQSRGAREVVLHAQVQAQGFYEKSGYAARGETFFEVDIEHILMVKRLE